MEKTRGDHEIDHDDLSFEYPCVVINHDLTVGNLEYPGIVYEATHA
jgi:hypothetical protein